MLHSRDYNTNHNLASIKQAIKEVACSAGIEHRGWHNPGSSWYGAGWRLRNMARLTVGLNKLGRAQLFGPGTRCRCAECSALPDSCTWGRGAYAGTMLLYLQEIAVNKWVTCHVSSCHVSRLRPLLQGDDGSGVGLPAQGSPGPRGNL